VVKNKVAAPFKQAEFDLMYNKGISQEGEILGLGEKFEILQKSGTAYVYGDAKIGRGYDSACAFLADKENKALRATILKEIRAKLKEVE
jgi:recombination protein RecA